MPRYLVGLAVGLVAVLTAFIVAAHALAGAAQTLPVATASGLTPITDGLTVTRVFQMPPRGIYVLTSGPISAVSAKVSCYRGNSSWPTASRTSDIRAGRLALGYDHRPGSCKVTATAYATSSKPDRMFRIALQFVQ
jgi:hypothetical protein